MKIWIKNHTALTFVVLTLIWSWGWWTMLFSVIRPGEILKNPLPIAYLFALLGGLGPSLFGVILTRVVKEREVHKVNFEKVKKKWWLALLIIPVITMVTPLIRSAITGQGWNLQTIENNIVVGVVIGIAAGLMEELGWRGFLLPQLLKKYPPLFASLIVGLVWGGLWHGYADYFGLGDRGAYFVPMMLLVGPVLLTAWSVLMTWVYINTRGSLLMAILMHAGISGSAYIFGQKYGSFEEELLWTVVSVGVAAAAAIIVSKKLEKPWQQEV